MLRKVVLLTILLSASLSFAQKPVIATAKVKAATVYFNSAEITQSTSVNLPLGNSEIIIKNVAVGLNEKTIQIGAPSTLTVLSVQFTNDYVSEYEIDSSSPVLKSVKDSIILVQKEIQKVSNTKNAETKTLALLEKNQQVSGVNSGLSVAELMKMVDYYRTKQNDIGNTINTLAEKEKKLNETLQRLNNKLKTDNSKEEKTSSGKLVVQVMNNAAGAVPLEIRYLANNASWSPFYDLRAESVTVPINMMYKAKVVQNTGIDWKQVKLTLCSGNPNQNNQAPSLRTWFLNYREKGYVDDMNSVRVESYNATKSRAKSNVASAELSDSSISNYTTVAENQLNTTFTIDVPYDILSNGKDHSVSLKEIKLPATYKYYAVPKVEKDPFLLAELTDYGKYNLLKGEANIIFEGMYVGKTIINPSQTSDTLSLSMGRDKKIIITRDKIADKSGTKFLSSKKEQMFTFDIIVRNNKKDAIDLLLKDQYPLSTNKDIEVELLQSDGAKVDLETGILTWQLKIKPNDTKKIRISYRVRYAKEQVIDNL